MKCLPESLIQEYIDKEIPAAEIPEVEAHLSTCQKCRELLENKRKDSDLVYQHMELLNPGEIPTDILLITQRQEKKFRLKKVNLPAFGWRDWRAALAGSILIFVLGIFVGKFFISTSPQNELVKLDSPAHLRFVLQEHFEDIKPVLIEYANAPVPAEDSPDILLDKEFVSGLIKQNRLLKTRITREKNEYLGQLLDELEVILREISALTKDSPESLSFIKKLIKEKEILFKLEASNTKSSDLLKI